MTPEFVAEKAREIAGGCHGRGGRAALTEARELTRLALGEQSSFFEQLMTLDPAWNDDYLCNRLTPLLLTLADAVQDGWIGGVSLRRQAELDVVSDILEQADRLLADSKVHPAAAAMIIGAALEEFLRTWLEQADSEAAEVASGINAYAHVLRKADLISKQDLKDVTSWAGSRNSAAHGEWEAVGDRDRIRLMLEGVNLFMRKHGAREGV